MGDFNPDRFRVNWPVSAQPEAQVKVKRQIVGEFIHGPVPVRWLQRAGGLTHKSIYVALELWLVAGMRRSRMVVLSPKRMARWGVGRMAVYRALVAFEEAGLVKVERHPGCLARITLLDAPQTRSRVA